MKFEDKHSFDKPADTVIRMFGDKAYFEKKYKALGFTEIEVLEHEKSGERFRIVVRYNARSSVPLPDFAKKFVPEMATITQEDAWDLKAMTGRLKVEIKGVPVKVGADMTLKSEGKGAANTLKWNVSCGIPLVGGKIEQIIANDIKGKSSADIEATRKILGSY